MQLKQLLSLSVKNKDYFDVLDNYIIDNCYNKKRILKAISIIIAFVNSNDISNTKPYKKIVDRLKCYL